MQPSHSRPTYYYSPPPFSCIHPYVFASSPLIIVKSPKPVCLTRMSSTLIFWYFWITLPWAGRWEGWEKPESESSRFVTPCATFPPEYEYIPVFFCDSDLKKKKLPDIYISLSPLKLPPPPPRSLRCCSTRRWFVGPYIGRARRGFSYIWYIQVSYSVHHVCMLSWLVSTKSLSKYWNKRTFRNVLFWSEWEEIHVFFSSSHVIS